MLKDIDLRLLRTIGINKLDLTLKSKFESKAEKPHGMLSFRNINNAPEIVFLCLTVHLQFNALSFIMKTLLVFPCTDKVMFIHLKDLPTLMNYAQLIW